MPFYRFVGSSTDIGERRFDAVGQRAEFSEEAFANILLGGGAFIPEPVFEGLGIPQSELDKLANPWSLNEPITPATELAITRARSIFSTACAEARAPRLVEPPALTLVSAEPPVHVEE